MSRGPARRRISATLVGGLLAAALVGCSSPEDSYCEALASEKDTVTSLAAKGSGDVLTPTLRAFERLRGAAPEELRDEWDTVVRAWTALADAVEAAGVDPGSYDPRTRPSGVTRAQAHTLRDAATSLQSALAADASRGIEDHARTVCKVDFAA